jgi:hypothetical protein
MTPEPMTPEPLSTALQQLWQMVDAYAARGEAMRLDAGHTARLGDILHRLYHDVMAIEIRVAELEAVAADLDLISYARQGEIGRGIDLGAPDGRPAIELTAAGYAALGCPPAGVDLAGRRPPYVGPLCGAVVDAADLFDRRRIVAVQTRLQGALDAGDEDEVARIMDQAGIGDGSTALAFTKAPAFSDGGDAA